MYYAWGQWPYGTMPVFRSESTDFQLEIAALKESFQQLREEWQAISAKVLEWETRLAQAQTVPQKTVDTRGAELLRRIEEQIDSLRADQITVYEQLLNEFLSHQVSDRIREIRKEITPVKIVGQLPAPEARAETTA